MVRSMSNRFTCRGLAWLVLLVALPAAAQVEFDGLKMGLSGDLETGYDGSISSPEGGSSHGLGIGGSGSLQGSYYNPNFLSFGIQPYYTRAQANAESASVFDSGGYNGNVSLFSGSHFPGGISFGQVWDATGVFGIPGETGLTTKDNSRNFGIGWSELVPGLPTVSVSYARSSASSSLPGSDASNEITNNSFGVNSTYRLAGWNLGAGFSHLTSDSNSAGLLGGSDSETTNTSTNGFSVNAGHSLPLSGGFGVGFSRTNYDSSYSGETSGSSNGTTDNAFGNLSLKLWKLPISATANYSDNLYGSFEQQILASGGTLEFNNLTPESRSLLINVGTGYRVAPHVFVNGYVNRQELWLGGSAFGLTQFGANVNANFGKFLKGLTVTVGMTDSASQAGNLGAGLLVNANYTRYFGHWELAANYNYDQNVQTLLAIYQTSSMGYGASIHRKFQDGLSLSLSAGGGHSGFVQVSGDGSHAESFSGSVSWFRSTLGGTYSRSTGTSILTPTGLVPVQLPIITNNEVIFNGKSRSFSFGTTPLRNVTLSMSYGKSNSDTMGVGSGGLASNNETELYTGVLTYRFRKLNFNSSVIQFRQSISAAGIPPSNVTTYYFGISRWFKGF